MYTQYKIKWSFLKNLDFSKLSKNSIENVKNMNYGTCREFKIKVWVFENFGFSKFYDFSFSFCSKVFWPFWCFCKGNCNF